MIMWSSLKLFPHIRVYLVIFANTEIYVTKYKTHWKIVKTTLDKFFDVFFIKGFTVFKIHDLFFHKIRKTFFCFYNVHTKRIEIKGHEAPWEPSFLDSGSYETMVYYNIHCVVCAHSFPPDARFSNLQDVACVT